ncbi:hypothetical protein F4810DRAFT_723160 [Camillea tinctor]|nr:hypothetical protein F4810DRAFT_723160 [Camillea tinctor]
MATNQLLPQALAQIAVQYMADTGACHIDLTRPSVPGIAALSDFCTGIEINVPQQHQVKVHPDSICITPTRSHAQEAYMALAPAASPTAAPPEGENLDSLFNRPLSAGGGNRGGGGVPDGPGPEGPPIQIPKVPAPDAATYPGIDTRPAAPYLEPLSTMLSVPPQSSLIVKVTSLPPPPASSPPAAIAPPETTPQPQAPPPPFLPHPQEPHLPPPAPARVPLPATPPPAPARPVAPAPAPPAPDHCDAPYTSIDVTTLEGVERADMDRYLGLLGTLGDALDGLLLGRPAHHHAHEYRAQTVHTYRVKCGVPGPAVPSRPQGERKVRAPDARGCLAECERGAIGASGRREEGVVECLGVAYLEAEGDEGENCRFWNARAEDHELLDFDAEAVERGKKKGKGMGGEGGIRGDWQVIYM